MARYTGASCRLCRREGEKLYSRVKDALQINVDCQERICSWTARTKQKELSEYGLQLRENRKQEDTMEFLKASSEGTLKWLLKERNHR